MITKTALALLSLALLAAPAHSQTRADEVAPASTLSLADLEKRVADQQVRLTEMEIRGAVVEVDGYDKDGREVELVLDRRSGEVLSRRLDD